MSGEPCKCGAEDCRSCNPVYAQQEEGLRGYHKPDKRPDLPACPFCGAAAESGVHQYRETLRAFVECSNGKCAVQPCCLQDSMAEAERGWSRITQNTGRQVRREMKEGNS